MELLKDRLRWAMDNAGQKVTQAALAKVCKVTPTSVNDWLSGKSKSIKGAPLLAASRYLNVNPEWLSIGKGRRRLNDSEPDSGQGDVRPVALQSQPAIFDLDTLHETLTLLVHDEGHAGSYTPRARAARLAELYVRVSADGGRLTAAHNAEFEAEVRARATRGEHGNELEQRPAAGRRTGK
jgi:transcriptional regulator with XRE-family HTH domain